MVKLSLNRYVWVERLGESVKSYKIDHVVIGPSGVFLIETKNWTDEMLKKLPTV